MSYSIYKLFSLKLEHTHTQTHTHTHTHKDESWLECKVDIYKSSIITDDHHSHHTSCGERYASLLIVALKRTNTN